MKIRNGYVSNSSSSSFIVTKDLTNEGILCYKLTEAQKQLINGSKNIDGVIINLDLNKDFWLTQYIFEGYDYKIDLIKSIEHVFYGEGEMSEQPYNKELFNEYKIDGDTSVYLMKQHDEAEQMKFSKFIKQFNKTFSKDTQVIVKYEKNGDITLKIVQ